MLTEHALNGVLRSSGREGGHMIEKAAPSRKVDALVAAILAYEATSQMEEEPPKRSRVPAVVNMIDAVAWLDAHPDATDEEFADWQEALTTGGAE